MRNLARRTCAILITAAIETLTAKVVMLCLGPSEISEFLAATAAESGRLLVASGFRALAHRRAAARKA